MGDRLVCLRAAVCLCVETTAAAAREGGGPGEPGAAAEAPTAVMAGASSEGTGPGGHRVPQGCGPLTAPLGSGHLLCSQNCSPGVTWPRF